MRFPSFTEFTAKATAALKRFPVTLTWTILGSFIIIRLINDPDYDLFKEHSNLILTLILGVSWLISAQFFAEQFKHPLRLWWVKLTVLAFLAAIYFYLPPRELDYGSDVPYIRYGLYFLAGHIFVFCAPFIMSWNDAAYFNYLKNILVAVARSILFSGVLYLGLVLAMVAVEYLFDVDFNDERYGQLFVFCLGIVNTWIYLSDFPQNIQLNLRFTFNTATSVFVKLILIPLAALYSIILYAYAIKIVINWELPEGWVSYLITALSALIFLIQFIIHPVRHTHPSRLIRNFSPLCYYVLLPLLPLLYIAIFRRLNDYGITENRYFLILLAFFITCSTIYLIWSRKKQLRFLPISLLLLILVSSVGPWGAFSVSAKSQLQQMEGILNTFNVNAPARRSGGEAKKDQTSKTADTLKITCAENNRLSSITRYLYDRGALAEAKEFLGYDPIIKFEKASAYSIGDSIIKQMGIKVQDEEGFDLGYLDYSVNRNEPVSVEDFQRMKEVFLNNRKSANVPIYAGFVLNYDRGTDALELHKNGQDTLKIPLGTLAEKLKNQNNETYATIDPEFMRLNAENASIKVSIIFQQISFEKEENDEKPRFQNGNLILLLKIKTDAP